MDREAFIATQIGKTSSSSPREEEVEEDVQEEVEEDKEKAENIEEKEDVEIETENIETIESKQEEVEGKHFCLPEECLG